MSKLKLIREKLLTNDKKLFCTPNKFIEFSLMIKTCIKLIGLMKMTFETF